MTAERAEGGRVRNTGRGRTVRAAPGEVRVLARACAAAAALAGFTAAVPFSPTAPGALNTAFVVVGGVLAAVLWWWRTRLPALAAHAVVVLATLSVSVAVAASTTPAGTAVTAIGFVWVTLFSAVFHERRAMLGHLTLILTGLALGLASAGAVSPVQTWAFVGVTTCMIAAVVNSDITRLRDRADLDTLTGTLTRAAFRARVEQTMAEARRRGEPLTLVLLDLDDFKLVNDQHGHAAGDRVLSALTAQWRSALASGDLLGRHGGDEFVLLLRSATVEVARETLGRMRAVATASAWTAGLSPWSGEDVETWLAHADADLYRRKTARPRS